MSFNIGKLKQIYIWVEQTPKRFTNLWTIIPFLDCPQSSFHVNTENKETCDDKESKYSHCVNIIRDVDVYI